MFGITGMGAGGLMGGKDYKAMRQCAGECCRNLAVLN